MIEINPKSTFFESGRKKLGFMQNFHKTSWFANFWPSKFTGQKNSLSRQYKKRVSGGGGRNIRETKMHMRERGEWAGKQICDNGRM